MNGANNDDFGLFTNAPKNELKGALRDFFREYKDTLGSYVGENLPTVINLSYGLANMVSDITYLKDASSKKDGHKLDCVTRGIVYTVIRTLSDDGIVSPMSYERVAGLKSKKGQCAGNSINEVYKSINASLKEFSISQLSELAKDV